MPKLNPDRICGKRGISALEGSFSDFKSKGKGREYDDLGEMMKRMQHWTHRLFPRLPFDDVTERICQLGKKNAVKTYLSKYRMNMIHVNNQGDLDEDDAGRNNEGEEEEDVNRYENEGENAEDIFEQLARQVAQREEEEQQQREQEQEQQVESKSPNKPSTLTEEQKERLERNKRLAQERRRSKMKDVPQPIINDDDDDDEDRPMVIDDDNAEQGTDSESPIKRVNNETDDAPPRVIESGPDSMVMDVNDQPDPVAISQLGNDIHEDEGQ